MSNADAKVVSFATPTWSADNVTIADVVEAVEELRRTNPKIANRTSVATLIIVSRNPEELAIGNSVIEHLGVRHPARIITLFAPEGVGEGEDVVNAEVTLLAGEADGHPIWSDEIRLTVSGGPARHLASLLRPLQLADLPVVVWYVKGLPNEADPLLKLANAVIVDTKTASDPSAEGSEVMSKAIDAVAQLARKNTIIDLSWHRLRTWRQLLAAQFNGTVYRPFIGHVESVDISGKLGPRTLLAGWVASRLKLDQTAVHTHDARHVSITMKCRDEEGRRAEFRVERVEGERLVRASASVDGGPHHEELLNLPDDATPSSVSASLKRLERDRVYEQSIRLVGGWL